MLSRLRQKIIKGLAILRKKYRVLKDTGVFLEMKNKILKGLVILRRKFRALKGAGVFLGMKNKILRGLAIIRKRFKTLKGITDFLEKKYENNKGAAIFIFFVLAVAAAVWALIIIPQLQTASVTTDVLKLSFNAENEARRTLAQIFGGLVVLFGVFLGWRRVKAAEDNVRVMQEGQITDRFTRAVEQLGNENSIHIRLGGIYALERIARDSQKDHWTIMEVLTAFVREKRPIQPKPLPKKNGDEEEETSEQAAEEADEKEIPKLPIDVQAALTFVSSRELAHEDVKRACLDFQGLDLRGADLSWAYLHGANLIKANLDEANLIEANLRWAYLDGASLNGASLIYTKLSDANLKGAFLSGATLLEADLGGANLTDADLKYANLSGAVLSGADLSGADLSGADLIEANLHEANLHEADLHGANLHEADLRGVDLSGAHGLTKEQIEPAITNEKTKLPDYLKS